MVEMCKGATANNVRRGGKGRDRQPLHIYEVPSNFSAVAARMVKACRVLRRQRYKMPIYVYEVLLYTPNWPSSTKYGHITPKYGTDGRYTTGVGGYPSP